jgi:hypothetical protein
MWNDMTLLWHSHWDGLSNSSIRPPVSIPLCQDPPMVAYELAHIFFSYFNRREKAISRSRDSLLHVF